MDQIKTRQRDLTWGWMSSLEEYDPSRTCACACIFERNLVSVASMMPASIYRRLQRVAGRRERAWWRW